MTKCVTALTLILLSWHPALAAPPSWASYTVTFDATWSAVTHPESFPPGPHFSGLVGGTHDGAVAFWSIGALASQGIKEMAEWGSQSTLLAEVETEIAAGGAGQTIAGDVLWLSPGQVTTSFTISPDYPLVSLVTMIAPSPDWFAGVSGLDLSAGDQWMSELVVPLFPHDAGTDSGAGYTAADLPTNPPAPITAIIGAPFSEGVPLGTLTFRLTAAAQVAVPTAPLTLSAYPNPFNPVTTLFYEVPAQARNVRLTIYDAQGRQVRRLVAVAQAGAQQRVWDGRTDSGRRAASGSYLVRLDIDGKAVVEKVALIQ